MPDEEQYATSHPLINVWGEYLKDERRMTLRPSIKVREHNRRCFPEFSHDLSPLQTFFFLVCWPHNSVTMASLTFDDFGEDVHMHDTYHSALAVLDCGLCDDSEDMICKIFWSSVRITQATNTVQMYLFRFVLIYDSFIPSDFFVVSAVAFLFIVVRRVYLVVFPAR